MHGKYHDNWKDRVAEALDCTAHGDKGKHGDAPKRCVECQMIVDTDASLRAALAAKENAEAALCRAREIQAAFPVPTPQHDTDFQKGFAEGIGYVMKSALSSSTPCPHELAEKRLREAVSDYHLALDNREHGGVAQDKAFRRIEEILGMRWIRGEEKLRRRSGSAG